MKSSKIRTIFLIFIFMMIMTACQSKGIDDITKGNPELPIEADINIIDENSVTEEAFPVFDVNSVIYENAIQNEDPVVDLFYNENIYAFYGEQIKVFDFNTKEEIKTILLEGLEDVNVPVVVNELNPINEDTNSVEKKSNTYVTAFTVYHNEYYVISVTTENTKSITKILRYDSNGKFLNEYPIQIDNAVEKIVIKDDKAIILSVNVESIQEPLPYYELTVYNFTEQKQLKVDMNKVWAVTLTDNKKAAIATIGENGLNRLLLMDMETLQIENEVDVTTDYIRDLDCQDQTLYILAGSEVFTIDRDLTSPVESFLNNYIKSTYNRKIKVYKDKWVIQHSSNNMLLYDFKSLEQKTVDSEPYTLTILVPYEMNHLFEDYIIELKKKYPNINLKTLNIINKTDVNYEDYTEKVARKLMAKDTDFDLYFMWDNDNIIKSDYYEDLSEYEQISHNLDEMLPGIKNLMSYNNKIYGVPTYISFRGYRYHPEELIGLEIQFPSNFWAVSDFYDFAIKNKDIIKKEQKPLLNYYHVLAIDTMFNTNFYVNYLQGEEFSSEDLASNFEMLKQMLDQKLITVDLNYKGDTIIEERYINALSEDRPRLAPVVAKENCGYLASIDYVAMNPSSPNKELAAELLTTFTDYEIRKSIIFQEISSHMQNDSTLEYIEIPSIFHNYTELDRFKSHKLYKELLEKSYRNINFEGGAEIAYLFEDFMNGKRTAKSAADEIIQRLDMIKYE